MREKTALRSGSLEVVITVGKTIGPMVYPSGLDWESAVTPTCPPAPGLRTISTGMPSSFESIAATIRLETSVPPPGG